MRGPCDTHFMPDDNSILGGRCGRLMDEVIAIFKWSFWHYILLAMPDRMASASWTKMVQRRTQNQVWYTIKVIISVYRPARGLSSHNSDVQFLILVWSQCFFFFFPFTAPVYRNPVQHPKDTFPFYSKKERTKKYSIGLPLLILLLKEVYIHNYGLWLTCLCLGRFLWFSWAERPESKQRKAV